MKIDDINIINRETLGRISVFRKDLHDKKESYESFSKLKHQFPYLGYVPCRAGNIDFLLFHAHDDIVAWEYLWFGDDAYETEIVGVWLEWCHESSVIYDIGAYTGLMSILAALSNVGSIVHLFEPMERTIERAKINVKSNRLDGRVKLHNKAASDVAGDAKIKLYRGEDFLGTGNSIFDKSLKIFDEKIIRCITIDNYLPETNPTIIKLDVEGHELSCLKGMRKTILRSRPKMIVEIWEHTRSEVLGMLNDMGYQCSPFEKSERRVMNFKCISEDTLR